MMCAAEKAPVAAELQAINRELADLLRTDPAKIRFGADDALTDEIVICGILGGKDVGKSTLINALAKTEVSVDPTEVGKGTERPMAYVHEATQPAVASRLHDLDGYTPLDVTLHRADAIRNVVLVDLPDFDSGFTDHLAVVRRIAPLLDRVLWVLTPRKVDDRAWVEMFTDVIKDPCNVHCVLNKVDELLTDADPFEGSPAGEPNTDGKRAETFWHWQQEWVTESIEAVGCSHSPDHRFLVAAAFPEQDTFVERIGLLWDDPDWSRYPADREAVVGVARLACADLDRLRLCVLGPVSGEQAVALKEANRRCEQETNVARVRRHFDLDRVIERLALACDPVYHQQVFNESMGPGYCTAVSTGIQTQLRPATELADELLEQRVHRWPLLRLVHWPFGWLSRVLGASRWFQPARNAARTKVRGSPGPLADPFEVEGRSLLDRIELIRARICADHAAVINRLGMEADLPTADELEKRATEAALPLAPQLEQRLLDDIRQRDRRPSVVGKAALWLILLWFPFAQPVSEGVLRMLSEGDALNITLGLYKIVSALSAVHLLSGFAVVVGIYIAILAGMYARALRAVRDTYSGYDGQGVAPARAWHAMPAMGGSSFLADAVDEVLVSEIIVPLVSPLQDRLGRLVELQVRLDARSSEG